MNKPAHPAHCAHQVAEAQKSAQTGNKFQSKAPIKILGAVHE